MTMQLRWPPGLAPALLSLGVAVVFASGCIFSPQRKPAKTVRTDYPEATTPQQALRNLIDSYKNRDSIQTAVVYDSLYQGSSIDGTGATPPYSFTRDDEIRHVGHLKLDPNIVRVDLDLGEVGGTWPRLEGSASDPPGYAVIHINSSLVQIDDVARQTLWESENRDIEYTFRPKVRGPGDTLWTVVRWTELAN